MADYRFLEKSPLERMASFKQALDAASAELPAMAPSIKRAREWDPYTVQGG